MTPDWLLSSARANTVGLYLMNKENSLDRGKFSVTGHGQNRPFVEHDGTEENRSQNRRVEFKISQVGAKDTPLEEIYEAVKNGEDPSEILDSASSEASESAVSEIEEAELDPNSEFEISIPGYSIAKSAEQILESK